MEDNNLLQLQLFKQLQLIKKTFVSQGVTAEMLRESLKDAELFEQFNFENDTKEMIRLLAFVWK